MTVKDIDHGYKSLMQSVDALRDAKVTVGIGEREGSARYENGVSVIDVAVWNEFGTANAPARSFIRGWFDASQTEIKKRLLAMLTDNIRKRASAQQLLDGLDRLGEWMVSRVKERIYDGIPPPNAPSTVKKKGINIPLIDTGLLFSSITYTVEERKAGGNAPSISHSHDKAKKTKRKPKT